MNIVLQIAGLAVGIVGSITIVQTVLLYKRIDDLYRIVSEIRERLTRVEVELTTLREKVMKLETLLSKIQQ